MGSARSAWLRQRRMPKACRQSAPDYAARLRLTVATAALDGNIALRPGVALMWKLLQVFAAAALLTGCAEYEAQQRAQAQAEANAIAANEDATCRSYGVEPGSPGYVQCRMNLQNQRAQVAANDRAIALQYLLHR